MIITGKIKRLEMGGNNPYGFISTDVNIQGQTKDPVFWVNDVIRCLSSDMCVGDIVQFHPVEWVNRNGDIQIIARQVESRISGFIKFIKFNGNNQPKFWGYIQPDNNWLGHLEPIVFFSDSFKDNTLHNFIDYCNSSFDSKYLYKFINGIRVDFSVQEWKANNPAITKVAKKIKLVDAKLNQLPVNKSTTKLLKDKISYLLDRIEIASDSFEFEDLVFILLRLIGINKICQYDRQHNAGSADGIFISGNLAVVYDCTLRNPYRPHKDPQIFNYKKQLRATSSITINEKRASGKDIEKTFNIPKNREIWIITRGETRIIEKPNDTDNICVREVSIKSLIDVFNQKLDSKIYGKLNIN